jgi:cytochrome b561
MKYAIAQYMRICIYGAAIYSFVVRHMKSKPGAAPLSFSMLQRSLHWGMAVLIATQFLTGQFFGGPHETAGGPTAIDVPPLPILIHIGVGVSILVLAVARLCLRFSKGVPASPKQEPRLFQLAATGGHIALYALMFVMPITGLTAMFGHVELAGRIHGGPLKLLLLTLIAVHVAAVFVHQFYWKTDVLRRMTRGI